ncbi:protein kinase [Candidatus Dependentiae bacterium]|nr:protein kinase [Candidatus Dependentiae bacterium]MBU4387444.1 protein kinase [Candidatus Dependentiae bacterium]MCG2756022.1 protein kinase [Candidatus Dependentiae bacterium]
MSNFKKYLLLICLLNFSVFNFSFGMNWTDSNYIFKKPFEDDICSYSNRNKPNDGEYGKLISFGGEKNVYNYGIKDFLSEKLVSNKVLIKFKVLQDCDIVDDVQKSNYETERDFLLENKKNPNVINLIAYDDNNKILIEERWGWDLWDEFENIYNYTLLEKLEILIQIVEFLNYMHKNGYVYRDLKFENILIRFTEEFPKIKFVDFTSVCKGNIENRFVESSFCCGTYSYFSPNYFLETEQFKVNSKNKKIKFYFADDIYSFGILMWELLYAKDIQEFVINLDGINNKTLNNGSYVANKISNGWRPELNQNFLYDLVITEIFDEKICKQFSENFNKIIESCWAEDVNSRPTSEQLLYDLENIYKILNEIEY